MDPADITTLEQLASALDQLRLDQSLSLRGLTNAAAKLPTRHGRQPALPHSTAGDLLNAKSVPERETVETFLAACGVCGEEAQRPWLQALERVAHQHQWRPPGAVRVRDARPRLLGVHAAIQIEHPAGQGRNGLGHGDELPPYVPRQPPSNRTIVRTMQPPPSTVDLWFLDPIPTDVFAAWGRATNWRALAAQSVRARRGPQRSRWVRDQAAGRSAGRSCSARIATCP